MLVAKAALQAALDAVDMASRSLGTGLVIRRDSWLQLSGFPREVQNTIQDFPFDKMSLFNEKMDEPLHSLKVSRSALRSLEIYTPVHRKKHWRMSVTLLPVDS